MRHFQFFRERLISWAILGFWSIRDCELEKKNGLENESAFSLILFPSSHTTPSLCLPCSKFFFFKSTSLNVVSLTSAQQERQKSNYNHWNTHQRLVPGGWVETAEHFASGFKKKKSIFIKINRHKRRKRKKINQLHLKQGDIKQRVLHPERRDTSCRDQAPPPLSFLGRVFFSSAPDFVLFLLDVCLVTYGEVLKLTFSYGDDNRRKSRAIHLVSTR